MTPRSFYPPELGPPQTLGQMLLSHHAPHEFDRCYRLGKQRLCARCVGIYPALLVGLVLIPQLPALPENLLWLLLLGLPVPALLDWGTSWLWSRMGTNWLRTLTGALLGLAVALNLHLQWTEPFQPKVLIQAAVIGGVATAIWLTGYYRRQRLDIGDLIR